MAERYTESDKWTKNQWFRTLPSKFKLFWFYLWDSVDFTGVYEVDVDLASYLIGEDYSLEEIESVFGHKIYKINERKWFIPEYLLNQYPKGINAKYPAVKSLREKLLNLSLIEKVRELLGEDYVKREVLEADYEVLGIESHSLCKALPKPLETLTDTDTDTNKEKDIEKEKESVTETDIRELKALTAPPLILSKVLVRPLVVSSVCLMFLFKSSTFLSAPFLSTIIFITLSSAITFLTLI